MNACFPQARHSLRESQNRFAMMLSGLLILSLALLVPARSAAQADPNKVLKYAFEVAETGFDPRRSLTGIRAS